MERALLSMSIVSGDGCGMRRTGSDGAEFGFQYRGKGEMIGHCIGVDPCVPRCGVLCAHVPSCVQGFPISVWNRGEEKVWPRDPRVALTIAVK